MRRTAHLPPLEVYMLGLVDFLEVQQLQRRIVYELGEQGGAVLILCEHPPTISVGRAGSRAHIAADDEILGSLGIKLHWVNRGGGCVLHLPGQLAAYFAVPLALLDLTVQDYLDCLHTAIVNVLAEFDLTGQVRQDFPGVFSGGARIATVGVAVTRWIAYHGLTLNVGPYLALFDVLDEPPIGAMPARYTSMESRRQRPASMSRVREALIRNLEASVGLQHHHIYTRHPQVRERVRPHAFAPIPG
jgi:lipoyl(octanoyl) transferase